VTATTGPLDGEANVATVPYRVPSVGRRIAVAVLRLVPLLFVFVVVPYLLLRRLDAIGVGTALSWPVLAIAGTVLAVLSTARYLARPTRAYGPLSVLQSAVGLLYLLYLASAATARVAFGGGVTFTIGYAEIFWILTVVPVVGIGAGLVTTVEDFRHPGERLPWEFPAPRVG